MILTGSFRRSMDNKQRVSIPKRLRQSLGTTDCDAALYVTPGTDGSLDLYPEQAFKKLGERLAESSPAGKSVRDFGRLFYANTQCVDMDSQGRIRIPQELCQLAGLQQEVMMIGVRDHLEIWDIARWENYIQQKQPQYDEIAEQAFRPMENQ